jgi:hypothetical protein
VLAPAAAERHFRMSYTTSSAVLLILFNREAFAQRLLAAVRAVRPARLFLAADAPRPHVPTDAATCRQTWASVRDAIDWPCEVQTLQPARNIGPARFIPQAVDWMLTREECGIILEEDCIPHPDFFRFCDELLGRYAAEDRVAMISGCQFVPAGWPCGGASYAAVRLSQIWGWATWRRAWQHYDFEMKAWPEERRRGLLQRVFATRRDQRHWTDNFDHALEIDSWDYQWCFARWRRGQVGLVPARNLVSNIGFGPEALHTKAANHPVANLPAVGLDFPLRHPPALQLDDALDAQFSRLLFCGGFTAWWNYQRDQRLARWLPWIFPPR